MISLSRQLLLQIFTQVFPKNSQAHNLCQSNTPYKITTKHLTFQNIFSALQTGVKVIIIISIIMVILVVIYAILYRLCKGRCGGKEK